MEIDYHKGAVLVTGVSTGIGRAAALHLDQLGFQVFGTVRNQCDAESLRSAASGQIIPLLMDVSDHSSIEHARDELFREIGGAGLAGLVNNAGVGFTSPLEFVPLDELRWLFEVNVFGLLAVTQFFLPLIRQVKGRIVNISSTASIVVAPFHGPYSSTKYSVNALSDALRLELKPLGVQVSVIVCGSVKTPIWDNASLVTNRITQDFPPQAMQLYGKAFRTLGAYFGRIGKSGVPPETAARAIGFALTKRKPKQTYYVGPDAVLYNLFSKLLYGRLRDWFTYRMIGLPT